MPFISYKRNGGLRFWRIGRLGGSFYIAAKAVPSSNPNVADTTGIDGMLTAFAVAVALSIVVF